MYKITKEEVEQTRTPQELVEWIEQVKNRLKSSQDTEYVKEVNNKKADFSKVFFEESIALAIFCKHFFQITTYNVQITQEIGNQNYDAKVKGCSEFEYIEITWAINGEAEALRREVLTREGSVSASGCVAKKGRKNQGNQETIFGDDITLEMERVEQKHYEDLIREQFNQKNKKQYNPKTLLLIIFKDYIEANTREFMIKSYDEDYFDPLDELFEELFARLQENFSALALIGLDSYFKYLAK